MSYRVRGMGMDRELQQKTEQKYSIDDENEIVEWIVSVLMWDQGKENIEDCDIELPKTEGKEGFQEWLKSGKVLCQLMNVLSPGSCRAQETAHIKLEAMKCSKERNNICLFLKAAESYGVGKVDSFQTIDLYESRDLAQVQVTMYKLGSAAQKKNFTGPVIGVKVAEKNVRRFDDKLKKEGQNIIGLQMGTNQVASQRGMTPYGLGRQMVTKIEK
uniref:transgelin-3 n=1 Tax=Ciona intestinalis TaxID=7719 RepID=UPI0000520DEF|nr:transgelin-3 [Ciona intestinalis]|eukprot:XP_026689868.1 transgelin-3 [Ciona intestinalis]